MVNEIPIFTSEIQRTIDQNQTLHFISFAHSINFKSLFARLLIVSDYLIRNVFTLDATWRCKHFTQLHWMHRWCSICVFVCVRRSNDIKRKSEYQVVLIYFWWRLVSFRNFSSLHFPIMLWHLTSLRSIMRRVSRVKMHLRLLLTPESSFTHLQYTWASLFLYAQSARATKRSTLNWIWTQY